MMDMELGRLMKRPQFLRAAAKGRKQALPGLVLQALRRPDGAENPDKSTTIRYGLTASKKVGNAVCRNRARRRLRALAEELLPTEGQSGYDYVLIARAATLTRPFEALRADLKSALERTAKPKQKNKDRPQ